MKDLTCEKARSLMILSVHGEADRECEDLAKKERAPRQRKPLQEIVFQERWEQPLGL